MDAETSKDIHYWYGYLDALRKVQSFALIRVEQLFWDQIADEHEYASTMITTLIEEDISDHAKEYPYVCLCGFESKTDGRCLSCGRVLSNKNYTVCSFIEHNYEKAMRGEAG